MHSKELQTISAAVARKAVPNTMVIRLKRDEEDGEMTLEERQAQCKAIEYSNSVFGMIADVANDIGSIPVIGEVVGIVTAPIAIVSHITSAGLDIASTALDCDDIPFDEIKEILEERFNEIDRKLDKNTAALEEVSKLVSKTFVTVEKTRNEMNENFKLVLETIESKEIKSIVFKINDFKKFFEKERQRIKGLPKDRYVAKLLEQKGILGSLKEVREPSGNSLSSALNELLDKNNNYAIPKVVDDNKAFQALYALFYGTQTYAAVMFFLLEQHSYLADYYYQKGDDVNFNAEFNNVAIIFDDFKSSLTGGDDGLIDNVIEVLNTVKALPFIKNADSKLYRELVTRTKALETLKNQIKTTDLPLIDDIPETLSQVNFPNDENQLPTPIGNWVDGVEVRYAVQYESKGMYSKFSEWSEPFTVQGNACPTIKVRVDPKKRNRLIFRKFNSGKPQFAGTMTHSQTNFKDIHRDLYDAALNINKLKAVDEATTLIEKGADIEAKFDNDRSAMHAVAYRGNNKIALRFLLKNQSIDIELKDKNGFTPLHIAAEAGQAGFVKLLINHGADVNAKTSKTNLTPLHLATRSGFSKTVRNLLESPNIKVNEKEDDGFTPLHTAVMSTYMVVDALLNHPDIDKNAQSTSGLTPFHLAIINESQEVAESLVESNADLNIQDVNHMAPIHFAASMGSIKMLRYLISIKDKVSINSVTENNNWTPLHFAIYFKKEDAAKELLKQDDINLTIVADGNLTVLHLAVSTGQINIIKELLKRGSNIEEKTGEGYTSLHIAAMRKEPEIAVVLIENGADIEARSADNLTPLHSAAKIGRKSTVLYLLEKGADIGAKTADGSTALHLAVSGRKMKTVETLLNKGANLKEYDNNKYLPIHKAIINDDLDMVRLFLEKDPSLKDDETEEGRTSIMLIVQKLLLELYNYFINNYAETLDEEALFNRLDEQGKLELAYIFHNKEGDAKEAVKPTILVTIKLMEYCLKKLREESGAPEGSFDSPSSKQCISTFSEDEMFRRTLPEIVKETNSRYLPLKGFSRSLNKFLPSLKFAESKNSYRSENFVSNIDSNGALLLLDVFIRKFTNEKYNLTGKEAVPYLEAKASSLRIASKFEELLTEVKGIPAGELINMAEVSSNIHKAIASGKPVSKVLCSYLDTFSELNSQQMEELVNTYLSTKPSVITSASADYQKLPNLLTATCLEPERMAQLIDVHQKMFLR
uniref:Delta-latroinsectotoxin-Lt1a n=2 Tax=Latrodectus tredecimguttatus TaxID=6925 RepID=LITD_LATTR|nr:RecName: Full=Delta-latroinsectotoxin-Lt1a; Short=Delta-LIT-Lt1a; AltName: Full=Delta-latroinsectotoxin; Short=Delta-LIT; Flags: Precursor [Latrodectus tredecimguttatus]CAA63363.1 delta-latroinsectotoxin precursor [Latrodectus tredecimguttatus]prf//2211313A delta-latroinsectotoxin [Latrodectus tredecimguttatus]